MAIEIISLGDLLNSNSGVTEQEVRKLLNTFETKVDYRTGDQHDVELFLKDKAIHFQNIGLSATHLVFASFKSKNVLIGYVSIANKPLIINYRTFSKLSKNLQRRFNNIGHRLQNPDGRLNKSDLIIPAYLIGQIGKNYSVEAIKTKTITGNELIAIAESKILEVVSLINGKTTWLECKPEEKLLSFYEKSGYVKIDNYLSSNELCVMVKKSFNSSESSKDSLLLFLEFRNVTPFVIHCEMI